MYGFTLSLLMGMSSLFYWPRLISAEESVFIIIITVALGFILWFINKTATKLVIAYCLGFVWVMYTLSSQLAWQLPRDLITKTIQVEGYIVSMPERQEKRTRFIFALEEINKPVIAISGDTAIRLAWYGRHPPLKMGEKWRLNVRLKPPHGYANPGSFDYETWLFQQGIVATGYVVSRANNRKLQDAQINFMQKMRLKLQRYIPDVVNSNQMSALLSALTIGEKSNISAANWQILQRTGTSHLMAISGLHIGFVAGLVFWFTGWLWRCFPRMCLYLAAPRFAALFAMLTAAFYAALAGFSVPTQRALIMVCVFMLSVLFNQYTRPWFLLCISLLIIVIYDPLVLLSNSFYLSFTAVAMILYGVCYRKTGNKIWWRFGRVQWIATVGMLPLSIYLFSNASMISPFANVIAIPWVSFLVVPPALLGTLISFFSDTVGAFGFQFAAWNLQYLWQILDFFASISFASYKISTANSVAFLGLIFASILLLAPRAWPGRYLAVFGLLPLFFPNMVTPKQGNFWVTVLDVGQGLAVVVQTQKHVLVYDTGPKFDEGFDAGAQVVLPFLQKKHISQLDALVISHGDNDHVGGARSLLDTLQVKQIYVSEGESLYQYPATYCQKGINWQWDGVRFEFLYPFTKEVSAGGNKRKRLNDNSCVLKITTGSYSVLLPGDIEKRSEKALLKADPSILQADVLLAPHHGSKTSSTVKFIEAVNPQYVIYPLGYYNRYRFPSAIVVDRYSEQRVIQLDTANSGAIRFEISRGQGLSAPWQYRRERKALWLQRQD